MPTSNGKMWTVRILMYRLRYKKWYLVDWRNEIVEADTKAEAKKYAKDRWKFPKSRIAMVWPRKAEE